MWLMKGYLSLTDGIDGVNKTKQIWETLNQTTAPRNKFMLNGQVKRDS